MFYTLIAQTEPLTRETFEFGRILNFGPIQWLLLILAVVVIVAMVVFFYIRDCVEAGPVIAFILITLRLGAFAGLLFIYLQPQIRREYDQVINSRALLLIDTSLSMVTEFVDNPAYGSMMKLVREGLPNVLVSRTASKIHGLAGLRVGFGFAHPDLVRRVDEAKTGQLNILGMKAAYVSYQDEEFQRFTLQKNRESMAIVEAMLEELGLRHVKSNANFTFFESGIPVEELNAALRAEGIYSGRPFPPYLTWSRISMAKPDEMRYYVQTYKKLFG